MNLENMEFQQSAENHAATTLLSREMSGHPGQEAVSSLIGSSLEAVNNNFSDISHSEKQEHSGVLKISSESLPPQCDGTAFLNFDRIAHPSSPTEQPLHSNLNNNSNAESAQPQPSPFDISRKRIRSSIPPTVCQKNSIEVVLEGKTLWDEFCHRGTEMIVNRAGRRMFPGFSVAISSLKPKAKYSMKLEVVLADNHRFKFLNSRWLAVGSAEPQPLSESYLHPDSPNSGAFWMRHGVSFRKLKITNNKERPGNNALLYSMHKYFLRLIVEEERKMSPGEETLPRVVLCLDFPETTFVAVTAYQNEEVTQLKITNNPFAKAFRENAADLDWETSQMLYSSNQSVFPSFSQRHGDTLANGYWPFSSPLVPSPALAPLPSPLSPLSGFITPNTAPAMGYLPPVAAPSFPLATSPSVPMPPFPLVSSTAPSVHRQSYFQWPASQTQDAVSPLFTDIMQNKTLLENPAYSSTADGANLPDFETVFTTLPNN